MKTTVVAVVDIDTISKHASNKEYLKKAKEQDSIYTLGEFEQALNDDDICLANEYVKFISVEVKL